MMRAALFVVVVALAACDTEPAPARPVLHGIPTTYGVRTGIEGRVTRGDAMIDGPLAPDALESVFEEHGHQLEFCYQRALDTRGSSATGRLLIAFTIAPTGAVAAPVTLAEDTVEDALVSDCMLQTIGDWTFPGSASDVHVRYPIELHYDSPPPG